MNPGGFPEAFSAALPALQAAVEAAGNPAAPLEERLTAANAFAESLGELWPSAEAQGPHITELLAVIDGLVSGLPHREEGSEAFGVAALEVLALLEAHLAEPQEGEIVEALLELTGSETFDPPLGPEAAALWQGVIGAPDGALPVVDTGPVPELAQPVAVSAAGATEETAEAVSPTPEPPADSATLPPGTETGPSAAGEGPPAQLAELTAVVAEHGQDFLRHIDDIAQARRAVDRTTGAAAGRECLERIAEAAVDLGCSAFATLCAGLGEQLEARSPKSAWPKTLIADLAQLPQRMLDYLADPLAEAPRLALVAALAHPRWPEPLTEERGQELAAALAEEVRAAQAATSQMPAAPTPTAPEPVPVSQEPDAAPGPAPSQALNGEVIALLSAVASAVADNAPGLANCIADLAQARRAVDRTAGAAAARDVLERIAEAAVDVGFSAFATLCAGLGEQLEARSPRNAWPKTLIEALTQLPQRMLDYLADPLAEDPRLALTAILAHPLWPDPLTDEREQALAVALYEEPLAIQAEAPPPQVLETTTGQDSLPEPPEPAHLPLAPEPSAAPSPAPFPAPGPALGADAVALLSILAAAVTDNAPDFAHCLAGIAQAPGADERTAGAAAAREILERIAEASVDVGFSGFATLCAGLGEQMEARSPEDPWPERLIADLTQLPQRMLDYLADPLAEAPRLALVRALADPAWPEPLADEALQGLAAALYEEPLASQAETEPAQPAGLSPDHAESAPAPWSAESDRGPVAPTSGAVTNATLSDDALELLSILASAVDDNAQDFAHRIGDIAQATEADGRSLGAAAGREILERFAEASADVGFAGFATLCAGLCGQLEALSPEHPWPEPLIGDLSQLPQRMLDYLADPLAEAPRLALVAILANPHWPAPFTADRVQELATALYEDPLAIQTEAGPARVVEVLDEDLSLAPADDIDGGVFSSFRREGPDLAQRLASVIQVVLSGGVVEDALRQAQRYAHTLKGSANVCGVRAIAFLGHHLEDLLEFLTEQDLAPSPPLGETLVEAADALAAMFDVLNGIEPHAPDEFRLIIQQVLDWANRIDQEGTAALKWTAPATDHGAPSPAAERPASMTLSAALEAPALAPRFGGTAPAGTDTLSAALEAPAARAPAGPAPEAEDAYLQVPARIVDDLLRLVGEMSLALAQSEEQLRQADRTLQESTDIEHRNLLQISELEKLVDLRGLGARATGSAATARAFDPLELDQYDEMYIATRRINEGVSDVRDLTQTLGGTITALGELLQHQNKLSQELRQLTMGTRLVPVNSIASRIQRAVRQTCRATGKEAELRVQGSEVRIDGDVLDRLMPALMHVVRNSIDHGIESPERRVAVGKPPQGDLRLTFGQSGDQIEVTFSDDGAGLDLDRIKAKAIANGLLDPAASPTAQELVLMTLRPGFSTRDRATQVSGRGVGMDVVANTVRSLNGTLVIESEPGHGYQLRTRFPSSLLTIHCLLVQSDAQTLALSANEVSRAVLASEGELRADGDAWQFRHGDDTWPLVRFNALLGHAAHASEPGGGVVLIAASDQGEQAVLVDALIDCRELVVKKLGTLVPPIPGLLAASILGDGRVVPIVELRTIMQVGNSTDMTALAAAEVREQTVLPTVLVVDDSLSMRRVLSQLVADAGYRALTARDGMAALQTMSQETVDVLLVDMEMPQMNGLELTAHLRARPATSKLPIAMITSRSTERHRREAMNVGVNRYFVKPYQDEEVLDFLQQALEHGALAEPALGDPGIDN